MVGPNVFSWSEPVRAGTHQNEVNLEYAKRCKRVHTDPDEVPEMHDRPWEIEAHAAEDAFQFHCRRCGV